MRGLKNAICALFLASALLSGQKGGAVLVGGGRLDWLVSHAQIVVKARVVAISPPSFEHLNFTLALFAVLKGTGRPLPPQITVTLPDPIWPERLGYLYREGATAIFFLQKWNDRLIVENNIHAILPAGASPVRGDLDLKGRLFAEMLPVFREAGDERVQARLLTLLSQVAYPAQKSVFQAYLQDASAWVQRAALAALLRLDLKREYVVQACCDCKAWFAQPQKPEDMSEFWEIYEDALWDRYHLQKDHAALLDIYRTIADVTAQKPEDTSDWRGAETIVHGLGQAGRREDALRLYRYTGSVNAYLRHEALDALCRMFDLPFRRPLVTSYGMPLEESVVAWEKQAQAAVRDTLNREGFAVR